MAQFAAVKAASKIGREKTNLLRQALASRAAAKGAVATVKSKKMVAKSKSSNVRPK